MPDARAALVACLPIALACGLALAAEPCDEYARRPRRVGRPPAEVSEMSGLAASRRHANVYWAHNDSDNPFELFAMRGDGTLVARFPLGDGANVDCEDIALGPCLDARARSCIYLADIGDNLERRQRSIVYEIPEPEQLDGRPLTARALAYSYADRPHNAEALLVDPHDARFYVVTKEIDSLGALYRIDGLGTAPVARAVRVHALYAPSGFGGLTTSASVHPSGTRVLLRTYTQVWEYRGAAEQSIASILAGKPLAVPGATQPQAEAISYTTEGDGYLLGTEKLGAMYRVDCAR
jgi:hypothetical protein